MATTGRPWQVIGTVMGGWGVADVESGTTTTVCRSRFKVLWVRTRQGRVFLTSAPCVGSSAQTKAMKKVAGKLKLDMAQFRDLAAFAQFGSELDKITRDQLERGRRLTEILKQPQYEPVSLAHQVMIIYAATNGFLDDVPVEKVRSFEAAFGRFMDASYPEVVRKVMESRDLDADTENQLKPAIAEFKQAGTY